MIRSMTGFGRGEYQDEKWNVTVEIKSVNHRYADVAVRMPRRYSFAEDAVRKQIKSVVRRGKIEVNVSVESYGDEDTEITVNEALAGQYLQKLYRLRESYELSGDITVEYLASLPDVMKTTPSVENEEEVLRVIGLAAGKALDAHREVRETEGAKLGEDLLYRSGLIRKYLEHIRERSPEMVREYNEKLKERLRELVEDTVDIPEDRIAVEAAVFADRTDITEEIVRLGSHLDQLEEILQSENAEGKRLDFLVQEMNREANTIGSKANDLDITNTVLDIKSEVEKIREQVQNIE